MCNDYRFSSLNTYSYYEYSYALCASAELFPVSANAEELSYAVKLNANGGSSMEDMFFAAGEGAVLTANSLSRENYDLKSWAAEMRCVFDSRWTRERILSRRIKKF